MPVRKPTHYEVLGVSPGAKHTEIGLAYNRRMAARRREDTPPDPRGDAMLREAFEVLSDLDRRAQYDAELRAAALRPAFGRNHAAIAALFVVAVGAGLYWHLRPHLAPETVEVALPGKSRQEILNGAIPAVGRLQQVDLSGQPRDAGIAFAVEEGVAVTACQGISPNAQLSVALAPRVVPANVTMSNDTLGLCKLEVRGAGSWPLSVSAVPAKPGDRVYATQLDSRGEVVLREAMVARVSEQAGASVLDLTVPVVPDHGGAPLLDIYGRVVAVASVPAGGKPTYVAIPPEWGETPKAPPPAPKPEEPAADPSKPGEVDDMGIPLETRRKQEELAGKIDPQRRERLEKAFRPPPTVPSDL